MILALNRTIPSQNVRDRWHWRQRAQDEAAWELLLRCAVRKLPIRPTTKVHVLIISNRVRKITDDANLRGGAKGLVDALVHVGFIKDDSDDWVHIDYQQQQVPRQRVRTLIHFPSTNLGQQ